ncbi:MAG: DNA-3-methyladenine glycosylase I [Holosporaceae bacterium]|jgi:DNA-3-methyladenine glycosylase I|nr:DNA-3-methyladenine glycosylase I [Holosporaceae bacterium]
MTERCSWASSRELLRRYHDEEWGRPLHDDRRLFEMLILEGKSCGLSWELILKKRDHMREVFDNFDPEILVRYGDEKIRSLMNDAGIIRSNLKVNAVVENAKAYLRLKEGRTFDDFLWQYVNYKPIVNDGLQRIVRSELSDKLSKDLKKLGFKFVGSVIIYSFMQAVGIVNDHEPGCYARNNR